MADIVNARRAWTHYGDDNLAEEVLGVRAGDDVTLVFNLLELLNVDSSITGTPTVTEQVTSDLTLDAVNGDGYLVEFDATGFVAEKIYEIELSVVLQETTGTQTLKVRGKVEAY